MKQIALVAFLLTAATAAWAHPGDHHAGLLATLIHLFSEPDHLAMVFAAVALGIWGARRFAGARKDSGKQS